MSFHDLLGLSKKVKVMKDKERLGKCHSQGGIGGEKRHGNKLQYRLLVQKRDISGTVVRVRYTLQLS